MTNTREKSNTGITLYFFPGRPGKREHFGHVSILIKENGKEKYYLSYYDSNVKSDTAVSRGDPEKIKIAIQTDTEQYAPAHKKPITIELTPRHTYQSWDEVDIDSIVESWEHQWKPTEYFVTGHNCADSILSFLKHLGFPINITLLLLPSTLVEKVAEGFATEEKKVREASLSLNTIRLAINLQIENDIYRLQHEIIAAISKNNTTHMEQKQKILILLYTLRDEIQADSSLEEINKKLRRIMLDTTIDSKTLLHIQNLNLFIDRVPKSKMDSEMQRAFSTRISQDRKENIKSQCIEAYEQIQQLFKKIRIDPVEYTINPLLDRVHQKNLADISHNLLTHINIDIYKQTLTFLVAVLECCNLQKQHKRDPATITQKIIHACDKFSKQIDPKAQKAAVSASNEMIQTIVTNLKKDVQKHFTFASKSVKETAATCRVLKTAAHLDWVISELKNILFWYQENKKHKNLSSIMGLITEAYKIKYEDNTLSPAEAFEKMRQMIESYVKPRSNNISDPGKNHSLTRNLNHLVEKMRKVGNNTISYTKLAIYNHGPADHKAEGDFYSLLSNFIKDIAPMSNAQLKQHFESVINNLKRYTRNQVINMSQALEYLKNEIAQAKAVKVGILRGRVYTKADLILLNDAFTRLSSPKSALLGEHNAAKMPSHLHRR